MQQQKSVLLYNTGLEVQNVKQLKELISKPCKVYKIVPAQKGDFYRASPATQLTCSTVQMANRQAKQISADLDKSLSLYREAVKQLKELNNLMAHRDASLNISKQVCTQLETYAENMWTKLAPGTRQKVQNDASVLHGDKMAERSRKEQLLKMLQVQEKDTMDSILKELQQISDCFKSLEMVD